MVVDANPGSVLSLLPGYPASWEFDGLLTNGEAVLVRPIQPIDALAIADFHAELSPESVHRRYFGAHPVLSAQELSRFSVVDYQDRMAFVAIVRGELVAFASYDRLAPTTSEAEIAFVVADDYQSHGVATLLFESLAAYARGVGIERFAAEVMVENTKMLTMFGTTGLDATFKNENGTVRVEIDLRPTPEYRAACDARESSAEAASTHAIFRPASIAVIGAGRRRGSVGHEVVRSLLAGDFSGTVYPINPSARAICGVPAFASISALPERIDLAIVAVPAERVPSVVEEAAAAGVRAVTIITAGFAETGRSGVEVESEMLLIARRHGMRIVGPNCLGLVNTDPDIRMNATFTGLDPLPGRLALVSQSGAVGIVLAEQASRAGLGLSSFVSVGNKLDVSSNDLLCFFERDARTSVIALYLESLGNPRKFARIARRVGMTKPIVALKAGRTSAGARGARSHTASAATPEVTVTALLKSAGVIKVDRLEELLDVAAIFLSDRLPAGRQVALVGNSGGPLILAADACESGGLVVPELDDPTKDALRNGLVSSAAVSNPVDLTADGTAEQFAHALDVVLGDAAVDAVIVVVTDLAELSASQVRSTVDGVARTSDKPIVVCILGAASAPGPGDSSGIAEVPSPERAAIALAHVCSYAEWRAMNEARGEDVVETLDNAVIREIVTRKFDENAAGGWLELEDAAILLAACGVPMLPTRAAAGVEEAVTIAGAIGFPVALKARAGSLVHKSEFGGVALGIADPAELRSAYAAMSGRLGEAMGGAVVQAMAPSGVEAIVGLVTDAVFGPLVMVGVGGLLTDLVGDHAFAVPPLEPGGAQSMVASLRAAPLLEGYRGAPVVDRKALVRVLETVARVAEEVPELVELDLNPVLVTPDGALVLDCKARLAPRHAGPGPLFRALRSPVKST